MSRKGGWQTVAGICLFAASVLFLLWSKLTALGFGLADILVALAAYLAVAICLARLNATVFRNAKDGFWQKIIAFVFFPAHIVLFFLLAAIAIPFFSLYPERHLHQFDVEGTDDQRRVLATVRAELRQKTLWRRLAERLRFATRTGPEWPPRLP